MWIMNQKLLKRKTKDNEPKETTKKKKGKFNLYHSGFYGKQWQSQQTCSYFLLLNFKQFCSELLFNSVWQKKKIADH